MESPDIGCLQTCADHDNQAQAQRAADTRDVAATASAARHRPAIALRPVAVIATRSRLCAYSTHRCRTESSSGAATVV